MSLYLLDDKGAQDVTELFFYLPALNKLQLNSLRLTDFRAKLKDHAMQLAINGGDSTGLDVDILLPLLNGRFQITGTTSFGPGATPEPLAGALVALTGVHLGYTATTTVASDGSFGFDNLPADSYQLTVSAAHGLFGLALKTFQEGTSITSALNIVLLGKGPVSGFQPATAGDPGVVPAPPVFIPAQADAARDISSSDQLQGGGIRFGDDGYRIGPHIEQFSQTLHPGTQTATVAFAVGTDNHSEYYFFYDPHPCTTTNADGSPSVGDYPYAFSVLLNGKPIWTGSSSYCETALNPGYYHEGNWFSRTIDVSQATRDDDAELRVVVGLEVLPAFNISASPRLYMSMGGQGTNVEGRFRITATSDTLPTVLPQREFKSLEKHLGIPKGGTATFNKWGLGVLYLPMNSKITKVRVLAQVPGTPGEQELTFTPLVMEGGVVVLADVGFPKTPDPRPQWNPKGLEVLIFVELERELRSGARETIRTNFRDPSTGQARKSPPFIPLYDAGEIPGALRYSLRETQFGGDGWGRKSAYAFLSPDQTSTYKDVSLIFNDLSLEHGGIFNPRHNTRPDHSLHDRGLSIDTRYLGDGGTTNLLNGHPADVANNRETGATRRDRLIAARRGDAQAQQEIVNWILQNRKALDKIFASHKVKNVFIGNAEWNVKSLVNGMYDKFGVLYSGDAPIINPATQQPLGPWATPMGMWVPASEHLNHIHIEVLP